MKVIKENQRGTVHVELSAIITAPAQSCTGTRIGLIFLEVGKKKVSDHFAACKL
jgi:hypothetical protein